MPSNDELLNAADFITLMIDDPKYSEGAKYIATVALPLATYVKSTLAADQR